MSPRTTYNLGRTCDCGGRLPDDGRIKQCDACKGKATRRQNHAAVLRYKDAWSENIWWLYFRNALRVAVYVREVLDRPEFEVPSCGNAALKVFHCEADDWRVPVKVVERVARAAHVSVATLKAALNEKPIDARAFKNLCAWLGWPESRFALDKRDLRNQVKVRAACAPSSSAAIGQQT